MRNYIIKAPNNGVKCGYFTEAYCQFLWTGLDSLLKRTTRSQTEHQWKVPSVYVHHSSTDHQHELVLNGSVCCYGDA